MPASPEVTGITIHRGELLQIKRMITEDGQKRGNLHGLFTESYQPVILIVFGGDKEQRDGCGKKLREGHALKKLGEWCVEPKDKDKSKDVFTIVFDNEGESCNIFYSGREIQQEIIESQSSFRCSQSVQNMLPNTSKNPNANAPMDLPPLPPPPPPPPMDQWYEKNHGPALLEGIQNALTENGFTIKNTAKHPSNLDITMKIQDDSGAMVYVYFPKYFPTTKPKLILENGRVEELTMSGIDEASPPDQVVDSFFECLTGRPATKDNEGREKGKQLDDGSQVMPKEHKNVDNGAGCSDDAVIGNVDNGDGNSGDGVVGNDYQNNNDEMKNGEQSTSPADIETTRNESKND